MIFHRLLYSALAVATCGFAGATDISSQTDATHVPIPLWENGAPAALGNREVDIPTITPFLPDLDKASGAAMIVCPGGGYQMLTTYEGADFARWLNELGITAFVLKYRLGSNGYHHPAMLNDVSRAIRTVRADAAKWKIDPNRIGVMGASAGGHLASTLLTHFDKGDAKSTDTIERQSSRPDLGILCYPVITLGPLTNEISKQRLLGDNPSPDLVKFLSSEEQVTSATPPAFLFQTAADEVVPVQNSLMFATALANAHVPFELHVYPEGIHGIALGTHDWNPGARHPWVKECERWLKDRGFTKP